MNGSEIISTAQDHLLDASIVVPTRDRAASLDRTLGSLCNGTQGKASLEILVVDNGSRDSTAGVVRRYIDRLPIRYLYEPTPGVSAAVNRALRSEPLGEIVVVINDDVTMSRGWLDEVLAASRRWPDVRMFGGRVLPVWPDGHCPRWIRRLRGTGLGLRGHDLGEADCFYERGQVPTGALYWLRRSLLAEGHAMDLSLGQGGTSCVAGEETEFFLRLARQGESIVYAGGAVVWHHVSRGDLSPSRLRHRAGRFGRTPVHLSGPCQGELLSRHPWCWRTLRYGALCWASLRYVAGQLWPVGSMRLAACLTPLADIHYNLEALRFARRFGSQPPSGGAS